jgi:hypothetical protein
LREAARLAEETADEIDRAATLKSAWELYVMPQLRLETGLESVLDVVQYLPQKESEAIATEALALDLGDEDQVDSDELDEESEE